MKVSVKPHSVDKPKVDVTASSSSNNQPPPPPPAPKVVPNQDEAKRRTPASLVSGPAEPAEQAHVRSSSTDTSFYPEAGSDQPRGRKRNPSKPKHVTISELQESLPEVKKVQPKATAKSEPKARSRTRSQPAHTPVLPIKDGSLVQN